MAMVLPLLVVMQILRALTWPGAHRTAEQRVFRAPDEFRQAWEADGGTAATLPGVDFEKEMVLAVFAGEKRTGGHAIRIEQVALGGTEADPVVCVLYRQTAPPPNAMVIQVLTHPAHAVVVKKVSGAVKFLDIASAEGAQLDRQLKTRTP